MASYRQTGRPLWNKIIATRPNLREHKHIRTYIGLYIKKNITTAIKSWPASVRLSRHTTLAKQRTMSVINSLRRPNLLTTAVVWHHIREHICQHLKPEWLSRGLWKRIWTQQQNQRRQCSMLLHSDFRIILLSFRDMTTVTVEIWQQTDDWRTSATIAYLRQGCRGYGYPWIYLCVDIRLRPSRGYIHGYLYVI